MHTTTRLPDSIRQSRPSRVVRLGAARVAAAVAVGVAIGRATGGPGGTLTPADGPPATDTVQAGPGPTRTVAGVPVGYAHSRDGAIAAAANYAVVLDSPTVFDSSRVDAALDQVTTADARDDFTDRFQLAADLMRERLNLDPDHLEATGVVMRSIPAGYRVLDYTDDRASVAVWGTSVFVADGRQAVGPGWGTTEFDLQWEDGDWRVADLRTTDGPLPPAAGSQAVAAVGAQIAGFEPFWQIPSTES